MVTSRTQDSPKTPQKQGAERNGPEPNKISASTPYDFNGKNLTPYGGLLPVITMLEKLGFQSLVEETLTSKRITRSMNLYGFLLSILLGLYIGFARLNQLRFIARDPIVTGILKVAELPVHLGRVAQWRPAQRQTGGRPHPQGVCGPAAGREADLRAGRFWVLLRGSGGGV